MIKNEYPRPQFRRKNWTNLNGQWAFQFDDKNQGISEKWYAGGKEFEKEITVPFVYQAVASGVDDLRTHDIVWYKRNFSVAYVPSQQVILHFGAVDYESDIYINGEHVCHHIGGHTSFEMDITPFLREGEQLIAVRAYDPHDDETIPRGKQTWEDHSRSIWYTDSTGIWQTVWFEVLEAVHIDEVRFTPLFDAGKIKMEIALNEANTALKLRYKIRFKGELVVSGLQDFTSWKLDLSVNLIQQQIFRTNFHGDGWSWTPENPSLFDVELEVVTEKNVVIDHIDSYFGFRKVSSKNGMLYLNNKPHYQKLILDQGYWPTGLLTAPTDEDFKKDIQMAKEMGFNGCRKHQKIEDPRFLYWADQLGYLVWEECAAAPFYSSDSVERLMLEWSDEIKRDYSHPSIVTWVPVNESWGVPNVNFDRQQQHFTQAMYHYIHALDKTRLVISNDGWAMTETDICAIHNYAHGAKDEVKKYLAFKETLSSAKNLLTRHSSPWNIFADGFEYQGEPIVLTEFGGIGYDISGEKGWGYTTASDAAEFIFEYQRVLDAVAASSALAGFCYTQLTDVEQEINGLLTYDRHPKCELSKIKEINNQFHLYTVEVDD